MTVHDYVRHVPNSGLHQDFLWISNFKKYLKNKKLCSRLYSSLHSCSALSCGDLLSSCAWKQEESQSRESLLPLHIIYSFILCSLFCSQSSPAFTRNSPQDWLSPILRLQCRRAFIYSFNFALQKHAKSGQRRDFAV